jgi:hypothetical protein
MAVFFGVDSAHVLMAVPLFINEVVRGAVSDSEQK